MVIGARKISTRFFAIFFYLQKSNKVQILINIVKIGVYFCLLTLRQLMDLTAKKALVFWRNEIVNYFSHFNFIVKLLPC